MRRLGRTRLGRRGDNAETRRLDRFVIMRHASVTVHMGGSVRDHCAAVDRRVGHAAELVTNCGGRGLDEGLSSILDRFDLYASPFVCFA